MSKIAQVMLLLCVIILLCGCSKSGVEADMLVGVAAEPTGASTEVSSFDFEIIPWEFMSVAVDRRGDTRYISIKELCSDSNSLLQSFNDLLLLLNNAGGLEVTNEQLSAEVVDVINQIDKLTYSIARTEISSSLNEHGTVVLDAAHQFLDAFLAYKDSGTGGERLADCVSVLRVAARDYRVILEQECQGLESLGAVSSSPTGEVSDPVAVVGAASEPVASEPEWGVGL